MTNTETIASHNSDSTVSITLPHHSMNDLANEIEQLLLSSDDFAEQNPQLLKVLSALNKL
jgi:hypothetical protein